MKKVTIIEAETKQIVIINLEMVRFVRIDGETKGLTFVFDNDQSISTMLTIDDIGHCFDQ